MDWIPGKEDSMRRGKNGRRSPQSLEQEVGARE